MIYSFACSREGNDWSHDYARRQWSLADTEHLRYSHLLAFEVGVFEI